MKKLFILAAAAVCVGSAAYAQKPTKGNVTTEVNLNLTSGNTTDLYGGGLAFRYFLGDDAALSLGFVIATDKTENNFSENGDGTGATGTQTLSSSTIVFRPGYQKHFGGSDKVSPWVGVELPITLNSAKEEWDNVGPDADGELNYADGVTAEVTGGSTSFGLTLNGGADWWFTDGMYLGVQVGWGYNSTTVKDTEVSLTAGGTTTDFSLLGGKSGGFAAQTTGGLRFGFKF
ncbi:MAG: hypothetical protein LW707_07560 [Sphingobacteriales bacterium]|nr:hypothetical protein [Sphingobacteriales bacterium]